MAVGVCPWSACAARHDATVWSAIATRMKPLRAWSLSHRQLASQHQGDSERHELGDPSHFNKANHRLSLADIP